MYVDAKGQLAFLAHPRTASTSLRQCLLRTGWKGVGEHHEIVHSELRSDMLVFSVIREPFDWFASWYFRKTSGNEDFHVWLKMFLRQGGVFVQQTPYILPNDNGAFFGLPYTHWVLFYDNLQIGLNTICEKFGIDNFSLPKLEKTDNRTQCPWTERSIDLLREERSGLISLYHQLSTKADQKVKILHGGNWKMKLP